MPPLTSTQQYAKNIKLRYIKEKLLEGQAPKDIANHLNIPYNTIAKWIIQYRLRPPRTSLKDKIYHLLGQGITDIDDISNRLQCNHSYAYQVKVKYGEERNLPMDDYMSFKEISKELHLSEWQVSAAYHSGMEKLQTIIKENKLEDELKYLFTIENYGGTWGITHG